MVPLLQWNRTAHDDDDAVRSTQLKRGLLESSHAMVVSNQRSQSRTHSLAAMVLQLHALVVTTLRTLVNICVYNITDMANQTILIRTKRRLHGSI